MLVRGWERTRRWQSGLALLEVMAMHHGVQVLTMHSRHRHVLEGGCCEGGDERLVWRVCRNDDKQLLNGPRGRCADLLEPL